ncbi:subtilisin-like protease SBT1.6 [Senna tora]|uniref:Subtilisin-like protease SBT1.6 n=1 Tax=Senna tora TaxID=362788 RepID=A0A834T9U4_9FABA|nr:subtilisin-like protease SBT1.6 [Senna tora]
MNESAEFHGGGSLLQCLEQKAVSLLTIPPDTQTAVSRIAKGVTLKARLALYKVCWKDLGYFDSNVLAAFDPVVADGVDVTSKSIGGRDGIV